MNPPQRRPAIRAVAFPEVDEAVPQAGIALLIPIVIGRTITISTIVPPMVLPQLPIISPVLISQLAM